MRLSETEAATRIQTIVRGQQAQEAYGFLLDAALEQEEAAICVQSIVRGRHSRRRQHLGHCATTDHKGLLLS